MFGRKITKNGLYLMASLLIIGSMVLSGCASTTPTPTAPTNANPEPTQPAVGATKPSASSGTPTTAPQTSQGGGKIIRVALVLNDMSNPFFSTLADAAKAASAAAGNVQLTILRSQ